MTSPLVDTNTLIAIESLFRPPSRTGSAGRRPRDPWATELVGTFSDVYIYEDSFRFTVPRLIDEPDKREGDELAPAIAQELRKQDATTVAAEIVGPQEQEVLRRYYADSTYETFVYLSLSNLETWTHRASNLDKLRRWLTTMQTEVVGDLWNKHLSRRYFFDLSAPELRHEIDAVSERMGIRRGDLRLALDAILRVPLYGEKTGSESYYVYHPQREAWLLSNNHEVSPPPEFPVSFAYTFSQIASKLTLDEFVSLLGEIRYLVRDWNIVENPPDAHAKVEVLREMAAKLRLPPRLRRPTGHAAAVGAALLALLEGGTKAAGTGSVGDIVVPAAGVIAATAAYFNPYLPRSISAFKMVRPLLTWELEDQNAGIGEGRRRGHVIRSRR